MDSISSSVFISRNLEAGSIFKNKLTALGFSVYGESLIEFRAIPFSEIPDVDWIFFYSKKAIQFFFKNLQKQQLPIPMSQYASIGKGTALELSHYDIIANFIGNGKPQDTAKRFLEQAEGQRVLFPRAAHSRQSIQQLLGNQITALDLVIYNNRAKTSLNLPYFDYLVFTSPLNAQAYFNQYQLKAEQKVVAIGETTAMALQRRGISKAVVAESPSEEALVRAVVL